MQCIGHRLLNNRRCFLRGTIFDAFIGIMLFFGDDLIEIILYYMHKNNTLGENLDFSICSTAVNCLQLGTFMNSTSLEICTFHQYESRASAQKVVKFRNIYRECRRGSEIFAPSPSRLPPRTPKKISWLSLWLAHVLVQFINVAKLKTKFAKGVSNPHSDKLL